MANKPVDTRMIASMVEVQSRVASAVLCQMERLGTVDRVGVAEIGRFGKASKWRLRNERKEP